MNAKDFNRLHALRMENDAAGYAMQEIKPRFDRMAGRHENGSAPRAVSSFNLFQTPKELAGRLVALVGDLDGKRVLEPSAGLGRLLDCLPLNCQAVAVEIAPQVAGELYKQNRPNVQILQRDFLTVEPFDAGLFDAVIMNPPFHMRADIRHIQHALTFLKKGGILAALCLDTPHRERALKPAAATWEKLDAGTFAKEGTRVPTVLLTIKI